MGKYRKISEITRQMAEKNETVTMYACIKEKQTKFKNNNSSEKYFDINLIDGTGVINLKIWNYDEDTDKLKIGDIVKLKAKASLYKDNLHLVLVYEQNKNYIKLAPKNEIDIASFVETVEGITPKTMKQQYFQIINNQLKNVHFKRLLNLIFSNPNINTKYFTMYAGKNMHHTYLSGLAKHTLEVYQYANIISDTNKLPDETKEIISTIALLHDIGEIEKYGDIPFMEITEKGRLFGHSYLGTVIVKAHIKTIKGFPTQLENILLHGILSHHGTLENGSTVLPSTIESIIVSNADNVSAKTEGILDYIVKDKNESNITEYNNYLKQFFVKTLPESA